MDQVLRWHFQQAVFANMGGAGEPLFESDFPPGMDMVGEIMAGPSLAPGLQREWNSSCLVG